MNSPVINSISSINDISKITKDTKYINLSIDNTSSDVIDYFLLNGQDFSYADAIDTKYGFVYVSYDVFFKSEKIIDNIIDSMPLNLNKLEKVRYLYIALGKAVSMDINVMAEKNEVISFKNISIVNNIWGSLSEKKVNNISICKLFMYLCSRVNIKSEIIVNNINSDHYANKVYLDDSFLVVDLTNDVHNVQCGFVTEHFDIYNDSIELDKRIGYVKGSYINQFIDKSLKKIDYNKNDSIFELLSLTAKVFDINNIGSFELFKIYDNIFHKYCPNLEVDINNLFVCDSYGKNHFIVINYNNKMYSFNYHDKSFMCIDTHDLIYNLKANKIGIYEQENFTIREKELVL